MEHAIAEEGLPRTAKHEHRGVKSIRGLEAFVTEQKVMGHHTESIDQVHVCSLSSANLRPDFLADRLP